MDQNPLPTKDSVTPQPIRRSLGWWVSRFGNIGLFFGTGVLLIVLLVVAQRTGWIQKGSLSAGASSDEGSEEVHTCPMHPQIRQPGPGRCPICGMALVPATSTGADLDELAVTIEPAQRRLANIKTAEVTKQPVTTILRTIGSIEIDESRQATIASYIDGRVERLFADYTGVVVESGDHLAVVYSPQLYSAQVEYVEAKQTLAKTRDSTLASVREAQTKLVANSRQRLVELGMSEEQLTELDSSGEAKSRLTIYAPIGGTVIEKLAEEGKYISAGEPIYRIANLSTVWLMLKLYPEDASRIRFGQVVKAELTSLPGKMLTGRVAFVDPRVDKSNRTVGVRVEFLNEDGELRPGDYAQATIEIPVGPQGDVFDAELAGKWISPMHPQVIRSEPGDCPICGMKLVPTSRYGYTDQPVVREESITVPRSALLMAGDRSVVYVETDPGRFEIRIVTLGPILMNEAVILDGLLVGEKVATSGNFLIDSQMQLAGKPSLIDPTKVKPKPELRNTPLDFDEIQIAQLEGETGQHIEKLYRAYFDIQRALSTDRVPEEEPVSTVEQLAEKLLAAGELPEGVREQLKVIEQNIPHLHHLTLEEARINFKLISNAIVTLATEVRGVEATTPFNHFFCPMVKQGEGDWLQAEELLRNPYFGREMLSCGELVRTIPPDANNDSSDESDEPQESDKPPETDDAVDQHGGVE
ncbi:Cation efflux system protein CusB precursor [Thalassoglobus neptunius]|uniref:Cation efflux system protein CusB n=1 Tax=Thalassoglobus neptunius TaxID=1938619 RepID=A0A5C5X3L7_9PLAN|nr:efflux RND transporter periplasmic adaptor subunit [Thalassoglobus neptunius]TWT56901.1 Cation efflux system protein CusB precursor [Thalassoglobus neptunius]